MESTDDFYDEIEEVDNKKSSIIINNKILENNIDKLRKKVFVKEKIKAKSNKVPKTDEIKPAMTSQLSDFIVNSRESESDFLLTQPSDNDPNCIKIKIWFFSEPKGIDIQISKKNKVDDVIKHIMTLYQRNPALADSRPL